MNMKSTNQRDGTTVRQRAFVYRTESSVPVQSLLQAASSSPRERTLQIINTVLDMLDEEEF
jgi:hypothetical protein